MAKTFHRKESLNYLWGFFAGKVWNVDNAERSAWSLASIILGFGLLRFNFGFGNLADFFAGQAKQPCIHQKHRAVLPWSQRSTLLVWLIFTDTFGKSQIPALNKNFAYPDDVFWKLAGIDQSQPLALEKPFEGTLFFYRIVLALASTNLELIHK